MNEHKKILAAIQMRDPEAAERACIDHMRRSAQVALAGLQQKSEITTYPEP